ncbi:MAG: DUF2202 domain-containing protein [Phycisphaerales bacterium]
MKRMHLVLLAVLLFVVSAPFAEAGKGRGGSNGGLSAVEKDSLLHMREEEKLARDVYLTLGAIWNVRVFDNIAESEQRHMDAVKNLLDKYGLLDPAADNGIGEFTNPAFTELYDQLIERGMQSSDEAYRVGVAIEQLDIEDLERLLGVVTMSDIKRVYTNLLNGSYNHLAAFESQLD